MVIYNLLLIQIRMLLDAFLQCQVGFDITNEVLGVLATVDFVKLSALNRANSGALLYLQQNNCFLSIE